MLLRQAAQVLFVCNTFENFIGPLVLEEPDEYLLSEL